MVMKRTHFALFVPMRALQPSQAIHLLFGEAQRLASFGKRHTSFLSEEACQGSNQLSTYLQNVNLVLNRLLRRSAANLLRFLVSFLPIEEAGLR